MGDCNKLRRDPILKEKGGGGVLITEGNRLTNLRKKGMGPGEGGKNSHSKGGRG